MINTAKKPVEHRNMSTVYTAQLNRCRPTNTTAKKPKIMIINLRRYMHVISIEANEKGVAMETMIRACWEV